LNLIVKPNAATVAKKDEVVTYSYDAELQIYFYERMPKHCPYIYSPLVHYKRGKTLKRKIT
jgi:hypothetical protein